MIQRFLLLSSCWVWFCFYWETTAVCFLQLRCRSSLVFRYWELARWLSSLTPRAVLFLCQARKLASSLFQSVVLSLLRKASLCEELKHSVNFGNVLTMPCHMALCQLASGDGLTFPWSIWTLYNEAQNCHLSSVLLIYSVLCFILCWNSAGVRTTACSSYPLEARHLPLSFTCSFTVF